jgi:ABC-type transporter Mla subunit MlaD
VLDRGVHVGEVEDVTLDGDTATVRFSLDSGFAPLRRGATIRVAEKTLFGEPYVDIDPGPEKTAALPSGSDVPAAQVRSASVDVDQALAALDAPARRDLAATLRELAAGARSPDAQGEVSDTLGELAQTTSQLRRLTDLLHGQEDEISHGVTDAQAVFDTLARRAGEIRAIVDAGETTLTALGSHGEELQTGLGELPALEQAAQSTLADAQPLLRQARPLARELSAAGAPLGQAMLDVPGTVRGANRFLRAVPNLHGIVTRFLNGATTAIRLVRSVDGPLGDALRNVEPIARFVAVRRDTVAAWFSNTGDLGSSRDAKGFFARFFVGFEPGTAFGARGNFQNNSYTRPHDAAGNQPYSGYPRLQPYDPGGSK